MITNNRIIAHDFIIDLHYDRGSKKVKPVKKDKPTLIKGLVNKFKHFFNFN